MNGNNAAVYFDLGSVTLLNQESGFIKFAKDKGRTYASSGVIDKPSISWIKTQLKSDYPIVFNYGISVKGEGSNEKIIR